MKLVAERAALTEGLSRCSRVTSSRPPVRILGGVRLTAGHGRLTLEATDLELAVTSTLPAQVADEGVLVAPARTLLAVVQALDGDVAELTAEGGVLTVRAGESEYRLKTLAAEDFPTLPVPAGTRFELDGAMLVDAVHRVLRAASSDLSRPVYTGVRITAGDGALTFTATDGYRLATTRTTLPEPDAAFDVLVPARALGEVVRLAAGRVDVELGENLVRFGMGECEVVARTLDGRPQDHARILATPFAHRAEVPRAPLLRAVDRASLLAARGSAVELAFGEGEIRVSARSDEIGEGHERVALAERGPTLRIGFNSRYLKDGLELVGGDDVWFEMNDGLGAVVLHGTTDDFAYLVAPLRLPD